MKHWFALIALLLLSGCSSDPVPTITTYPVEVVAGSDINPYQQSSANPVVIRLYQLTDQQMFQQLDFIDLYNSDVERLAANLVSKQVLPIVIPGSTTNQSIDLNKNTLYLAVLAEFADYQSGTTKAVTLLPTEADQYFRVTLAGATVSIEVVTPESSWWQIF